MTTRHSFATFALALAGFGLAAAPALAGSHLWRINEIFSNADGTIQFIELREFTGANFETHLTGRDVETDVAGGAFEFPVNIAPPTGFKYLLLATTGFAALPGAPTPDFTLSDNFFEISGDVIRWGPNPPSNVYHVVTFADGDVPSDGINSMHITDYRLNTFEQLPNSPTNYHDQTGSVDASGEAPQCPWDCDGSDDGLVGVDDFLAVLAQWGQPGTSCHFAGGGAVGVDEFLDILAHWGDCP